MKKALMFILSLCIGFSAFAAGQQGADKSEERSLLFTTMSYGDINSWADMWKTMSEEFYAETGIEVTHEVVNWSQAREKITTWHLGGDAPDVMDMFWSKTYSDLGAGQYGTRPIEDSIEQYIPDFYERFPESALGDVQHKGHLYGVPWRIDVRPMIYRKDFLEEAGIDPDDIDTWEDLLEAGKKLTRRDGDGNVTRYGIGFNGNKVGAMYSWLWQAGGSFLNANYDAATVDSSAGREAMSFVYAMVNEHEIAPIDYFLDPAYDSKAEFAAGNIAIIPFTENLKSFIENNAPQLADVTVTRKPVRNKTQNSFQGAGYFSATYQTEDLDAAMQWLAFISRTENMLTIGKKSGNLTPCIPALEDEFYQNDWWFSGQIEALPYGRTTQHPTPAWGAISNDKPGSPLHDMVVSILTDEMSIEEALRIAQDEMQTLMDDVQ